MSVPKHVIETLATLRSERSPLAGRLDAIDLAIENLSRVWGLGGQAQATIPFVRHAPLEKASKPNGSVASDTSEASARRSVLSDFIRRSESGMTTAELRKHTPKMDPKDRQNALTTLKAKGEIRRVGNMWIKAS